MDTLNIIPMRSLDDDVTFECLSKRVLIRAEVADKLVSNDFLDQTYPERYCALH